MRTSFIVNEVTTGLRRNITMTIAMILTTAISLALFGGGLLVVNLAEKSKQIFLSRVEVQLFLKDTVVANDPDCTKSPCADLRHQIDQFPGVQSDIFISKQAAIDDARKRTFANQPALKSLLTPGVLPASFRVKVSTSQQIDQVVEEFGVSNLVDRVLDQRVLVNRIFTVLNGARNMAFLIALVQAVAAILLIANTIQIAAFSRRTEVKIMGLVGASRWYMQLPFLLEAVLASFIGAALAIGGLFLAKTLVIEQSLHKLYQNSILAPISTTDILLITPYIVATGVILSAVTAYITLRLYVRN